MFVKNAWYVAALARDVDRKPVQSRLLGDAVVLFRKQTGEPVALRDRCPHRHAPLSLGTLIGDDIQCRYHGFQFDCGGACTAIPGEKTIPAAISVDTFPVVERHGFVWVWMGVAAAADAAKVPQWPWGERADFMSYHADLLVHAPVQMLIDNLMDLTHVHFVHKILGANNLVHESEPMQTWEKDDEVFFRRDLKRPDTTATGAYTEIGGRYFAPSVVVTSGVPKRVGSEDIQPGPVSQVLHCLTPVDERTTRYFAVKSWNAFTQPHQAAAVHHQIDVTLAEDKEIIEAQFASKQAAPEQQREKLIRADRAAVMARRVYERVLEREQRAREQQAQPLTSSHL
jgi:vanillate O-demethylase monooxygenase subunit